MAVPDLQDALDCLQQEDVDEAIARLERKVEELPAHLTAYVLLARAHEAKHQWERALQSWENVYFLMPNSPVAREGKRRVLRRMDRGKEAEDIEDATPSTPSSPDSPSASDSTAAEAESAAPEAADDAPPEDDTDETETTATKAVSELEKLRRQAEDEARQGGARPELADTPKSDNGDTSSTPEERIDQMEEDGDDLDQLIDELESARIEPDPDVESAPAPDLESDVDDLVSETLGRIHEAQDEYRQAAQIYVKLASQEPDQARDYLEKAAEMRRKAESTPSEEDDA